MIGSNFAFVLGDSLTWAAIGSITRSAEATHQ
jgi:hypothetical protein